METYFLKDEDVFKFYSCIAQEYELYVPVKVETSSRVKCDYGFNLPSDDYCLRKFSEVDKNEIIYNDYRSIEPIRTFLTYIKEEACTYFKDQPQDIQEKPLAICGVKNCDIFSLKIQDFVFLGGNEVDPLYQKRRASTLIITSDCPNFKEACFCRAFDINPYAAEGFDFNLSPLTGGFLVDVASDKAKRIVDSLKDVFTAASFGQISGRNAKREIVVKKLDEHLACHKIPKKDKLKEIVTSGLNSKVWQEQMQTCVECGGCVFMCDTCHCFLLADEPSSDNVDRLRLWDGCMFKNFSRVAGGANPLKMRYMRLRNRYLKKFDFFIDNLGVQGCCGCGRCIDVCPGKIDIRYILRKLYEEKYISAV
jgi:ferredoxin